MTEISADKKGIHLNEGTTSMHSNTVQTLEIIRLIRAPKKLVYDAWVTPEMVSQWWGPEGFTCPECSMDARPGGAITIRMQSPDGSIYPMEGHFVELTEGEKLVFTGEVRDEKGNIYLETKNTVIFEQRGEETKLTLRAEVTKALPEAAAAISGMQDGWYQSLDKLQRTSQKNIPNVLSENGAGAIKQDKGKSVMFIRTYDAPRQLVFDCWTKKEHIDKWWGPAGFATETIEMNFKQGDTWRHTMTGPDGTVFPNLITYTTIRPPEEICYVHGSGEHEDSPFRMQVLFEAIGSKTKITMKMTFETTEELARVEKYGVTEGGIQTLNRLAGYLAQR